MLALALVAVFAFGAITGSSAFAVSKLLFKTVEITEGLTAEVAGNLLLEDVKLEPKADVLCSGGFVIHFESGELGLVTEVLTLAKTLLPGAVENSDLVECESSICFNPVDVEARNLPWHVEIELNATLNAYLVDFLEEAGKIPQYVVHCKTLIGEIEDRCEGLSAARAYLDSTSKLRFSFNQLSESEPWGAESPLTVCTQGGPESGLLESEDEAGNNDTETAGGVIEDLTEKEPTAWSLSE